MKLTCLRSDQHHDVSSYCYASRFLTSAYFQRSFRLSRANVKSRIPFACRAGYAPRFFVRIVQLAFGACSFQFDILIRTVSACLG